MCDSSSPLLVGDRRETGRPPIYCEDYRKKEVCVIPAAILEAEVHVLSEGRNAGRVLSSLDDDTLAAVVTYYRPRDFREWRAAYLTACARVLRAFGLFDVSCQTLTDIAGQGGEIGQAARWYLENFGKGFQ
jgi:hypothetical protein